MSESESDQPIASRPLVNLPDDPEFLAKAQAFLRRTGEGPTDAMASVDIPGNFVTITESAEELFKAIAPRKQLFYRGGAVVEVVREGEGYEVIILDAVAAQSRFEKYALFFKRAYDKDTEKFRTSRTTISEAIAKQYLKSEACRDLLPRLNGVLNCSLLVEKQGQLHRMEKGYDETTGFFVAANEVPAESSLEDAVTFIKTLVRDFDFVTPGDRSRAIASFLTPALKFGGFIKGPVPVDVAEANISQSGKTYRQKLVAAVYNQKPAVVTKKGGGVGSMEETFSEHLVKGKTFIQFDNVRGKLDSQMLEAFLTADGNFPARIPYHGQISVDPSKFIVFISSNGFEATKDLTNRASIIRIRKKLNYQFQSFNGMDLLQFTFAYQPLLLGAVLKVVEEWYKTGKPTTNDTRHDFREWGGSLDWIVQNIFKEAPLMDGHEEAKERAASPQLTFLRAIAMKLNETNKLNQGVTASDIADLALDSDLDIPGLALEHQTVDEGRKQIGRIMAKLFGDERELAFDEFQIVKQQRSEPNQEGNNQILIRYTFALK